MPSYSGAETTHLHPQQKYTGHRQALYLPKSARTSPPTKTPHAASEGKINRFSPPPLLLLFHKPPHIPLLVLLFVVAHSPARTDRQNILPHRLSTPKALAWTFPAPIAPAQSATCPAEDATPYGSQSLSGENWLAFEAQKASKTLYHCPL
jgi:hypothetical protein